jgi:predicted outer membrane repeat protein
LFNLRVRKNSIRRHPSDPHAQRVRAWIGAIAFLGLVSLLNLLAFAMQTIPSAHADSAPPLRADRVAPAIPAASYSVTNTNDTGTGSLRDAIAQANSNPGSDTINFGVSGIMTLTSKLLVTDDLTIDATGHTVTVSGNSLVRVLEITATKTLSLTGITIAKGQGEASNCVNNFPCGGGAMVNGTLNVFSSTFTGNIAPTSTGGGINNTGTVNVYNSVFSKNTANTDGGAIYGGIVNVYNSTFLSNTAYSGGGILASTLVVSNTTFTGNLANSTGGGIEMFSNAKGLTVLNSTFVNNTANESGTFGGGGIHTNVTARVANSTFYANHATNGGGGGINNAFKLTVSNSTFSGNTANAGGGGIYNISQLILRNTIIANSNGGSDCGNLATTTGSYNLIAGNACGLLNGVSGNIVGYGPNLGPLANNGGATQTLALLPGSLAANAGSDATCAASPVNGLDQRGVHRPISTHCSIGAYEAPAWLFLPFIVR